MSRRYVLLWMILGVLGLSYWIDPVHFYARLRYPTTPDQKTQPYGYVQQIPGPTGFVRVSLPLDSWGYFLRNLPLKSSLRVHLWDGTFYPKALPVAAILANSPNTAQVQTTQVPVWLRMQYFQQQQRPDSLSITLKNGIIARWTPWKRGQRAGKLKGKTVWEKGAAPDSSETGWQKFQQWVLEQTDATSLLKTTQNHRQTPAVGDIWLLTQPSPVVYLVVDVAYNATSGQWAMLLARGGTPAQDIGLAIVNAEKSPWVIYTPDKTFEVEGHKFSAQALRQF